MRRDPSSAAPPQVTVTTAGYIIGFNARPGSSIAPLVNVVTPNGTVISVPQGASLVVNHQSPPRPAAAIVFGGKPLRPIARPVQNPEVVHVLSLLRVRGPYVSPRKPKP